MLLFKRITKIFLGVIFLLVLTAFSATMPVYAQEDELYLGGFAAGFILNTQSVEVIGTCEITTEDGSRCPARESGLKSGDIIKSLNGLEIKSAGELTKALAEDYAQYNLTVLRAGESIEININPIIDKTSGKKRLGLLVKDTINGIGTVTYVDKLNNKFGSLGHPVTDSDGNLMQINGGSLFACSIYDVKRGQRGNPGELKGIFNNTEKVGEITDNNRCGIFGTLSENFSTEKLDKVKRGSAGDAQIGTAYIYSTIDGNVPKRYEVGIVKVDAANKDNRNYVIKVNDERLIDATGGIVQGMSGSPIVQNGKLIGAVTHVFVNDPTRGYGISLDKMTNS